MSCKPPNIKRYPVHFLSLVTGISLVSMGVIAGASILSEISGKIIVFILVGIALFVLGIRPFRQLECTIQKRDPN